MKKRQRNYLLVRKFKSQFEFLYTLPNITDEQVVNKLDELSVSFPCKDNKPTVSMTGDYTLQETSRAYLGMLCRLKIFVESKYNKFIGIKLGYENVRCY